MIFKAHWFKAHWVLVVLLTSFYLVNGADNKYKYRHCKNDLRIRKEIHDLSDAELSRFMHALQLFMNSRNLMPKPHERLDYSPAFEQRMNDSIEHLRRFKAETLSDPDEKGVFHGQAIKQTLKMLSVVLSLRNGLDKNISKFINFYANTYKQIRNTPAYLHWHRVFLMQFEDGLREFDPNVTLPYWAWSYEAYDARSSLVFSDGLFGSHLDPTSRIEDVDLWPGSNIKTGVFTNLRSEMPDSDFVTRGYRGDEPLKFHGRNCFKALENENTSWLTLSETLEHFSMAFKHAIGGTMSTLSWAPADPLFLFHYSYMDYEWDKWQNIPHNSDAYSYYAAPGQPIAQYSDMLPGLDVNIGDSIDNAIPCVKYQHPKKISKKLMKMRAETRGQAGTSFPLRLPNDFMLGLSMGLSVTNTSLIRESMLQMDNICQ